MIRQMSAGNVEYATLAVRRHNVSVRESRSAYLAPVPMADVTPTRAVCFLCGRGSEVGALEGSGHAGDCVHLDCLATQAFDWDAAAS